MKAFIVILLITIASCHSSKKITGVDNKNNGMDSSFKSNAPACVDSMIQAYKKAELTNPPRKIFSYTYRNQTVYYVPALCCDFFSELYDSNCKLIGHPDGGYTGKGDGTMPDFSDARKNEKLIWEDEREKKK